MRGLKRRANRRNQHIYMVGEVARRLRVSDMHVLNLIECGQLEAIDTSGGGSRRMWRIPREAFERFQTRNGSMTTGGGK